MPYIRTRQATTPALLTPNSNRNVQEDTRPAWSVGTGLPRRWTVGVRVKKTEQLPLMLNDVVALEVEGNLVPD